MGTLLFEILHSLGTKSVTSSRIKYVHMRHACHFPLIGTWLQLMFGSRSGQNQHACNFFPPSQPLERMLIMDIVAPTILSFGNWVSWLASYRVIPIDSWIKGWICCHTPWIVKGPLLLQMATWPSKKTSAWQKTLAFQLSYWHKLCRYKFHVTCNYHIVRNFHGVHIFKFIAGMLVNAKI